MERESSRTATAMSVLARLALILPPAAVAAGMVTGPAASEAVAECWYGSGRVCGCSFGISPGCGPGDASNGAYCGEFSGTCDEVTWGCQYYSGCGGY